MSQQNEVKPWEKLIHLNCPYPDCGRPFTYDTRTEEDFPNGKKPIAYVIQSPIPPTYDSLKEELGLSKAAYTELLQRESNSADHALKLAEENEMLRHNVVSLNLLSQEQNDENARLREALRIAKNQRDDYHTVCLLFKDETHIKIQNERDERIINEALAGGQDGGK